MAGGEFCGNATRSAAVALYERYGKDELSFTVSRFTGTVNASVKPLTEKRFFVEVTFPGMVAKTKPAKLQDDTPISIVDLGGIVHIVIEGEFPKDEKMYTTAHRRIVDQFGLSERDAVGVVWFERESNEAVVIHPVVWVRAVDTFYYESQEVIRLTRDVETNQATYVQLLTKQQENDVDIFIEQPPLLLR